MTYVPSKKHQHRPRRLLAYISLEPFLRLPLRVSKRLPANLHQKLPSLHGRRDLRLRISDRPSHLLREFAGQVILFLEDQSEGALDDGLAFGEGDEAVGIEGLGGGCGQEAEFRGGEGRSGENREISGGGDCGDGVGHRWK